MPLAGSFNGYIPRLWARSQFSESSTQTTLWRLYILGHNEAISSTSHPDHLDQESHSPTGNLVSIVINAGPKSETFPPGFWNSMKNSVRSATEIRKNM